MFPVHDADGKLVAVFADPEMAHEFEMSLGYTIVEAADLDSTEAEFKASCDALVKKLHDQDVGRMMDKLHEIPKEWMPFMDESIITEMEVIAAMNNIPPLESILEVESPPEIDTAPAPEPAPAPEGERLMAFFKGE